MMFPRRLPFPDWVLNTHCRIEIYSDGIDETTGEPETIGTWNGNVSWSEKSKSVMTADKIIVDLVGTIIARGDICPNKPIQGGKVTVFPGTPREQTMRIYASRRGRNLDGSVYSTELDLM